MFSRFHRRGPSATASASAPSSPVPIDQFPLPDSATGPDRHRPLLKRDVGLRPPSAYSADLTVAAVSSSAFASSSASAISASTDPSDSQNSSLVLPAIARVASLERLPPDSPSEAASTIAAEPTASSNRLSVTVSRRPVSTPVSPSFWQQLREPLTMTLSAESMPAKKAASSASAASRASLADLPAAAAAAAASSRAPHGRALSSTEFAASSGATSPPAISVAAAAAAQPSQSPLSRAPERRLTRSKPPPPPINTGVESRPHHSAQGSTVGHSSRPSGYSFVTPTDLQTSAAVAAMSAAGAVHDSYYNNSNNSSSGGGGGGSGNGSGGGGGGGGGGSSGSTSTTVRPRKGLPFLMKNPVSSLLGRRKASQSSIDSTTLSASNYDVPVYAPIRGTRFHDFSAPRPRPVVSSEASAAAAAKAAAAAAAATIATSTATTALHSSSTTTLVSPEEATVSRPTLARSTDSAEQRPANESSRKPPPETSDSDRASSAAAMSKLSPDSRGSLHQRPLQALQPLQENRQMLFDKKPLPEWPASQESPSTTKGSPSVRSVSTRSRTNSADVASLLKSNPSTATTRSRKMSLPDTSPNAISSGPSTSATTPASAMSILPKHMKSTSSRFSFMVGSASQEKLLEDRHRQKQLEKSAAAGSADGGFDAPGARDSRFDDFDEDSFDYDAMMDDDGLEERIPGVNADAEDDMEDDNLYGEIPYLEKRSQSSEYSDSEPDRVPEHIPQVQEVQEQHEQQKVDDIDDSRDADDAGPLDPDNDQENFAGFVFQRSNPASSLATPISPVITITPRDVTGKVIGFAMTKDATPDFPHARSPLSPTAPEEAIESQESMTMQAVSVVDSLGIQQTQAATHLNDDDLYFDQGLIDELNFGQPEGSEVPFDESIFDSNDTDQYGRPIPGAFAKLQAQRLMARTVSANQKADAQLKTDVPDESDDNENHLEAPPQLHNHASFLSSLPTDSQDSISLEGLRCQPPPPLLTDAERVVAYQAALAEAAHKAAASGKFRRDSFSPPDSPTVTSLNSIGLGADKCLGSEATQPKLLASVEQEAASSREDYQQDLAYTFSGCHVDDDGYDDGFTENMDDYDFDDDAIAEANALALANDMDGFYGQEFNFYSAPLHHSGSTNGRAEYANGGYFVPTALGRSTSGRVVSREPNLTPITERSEYSNRNSVLSLMVPPGGGSAGDLRSPGLSQLAMMADDGDMSLSALMRLRNKAFGGSQASLASSSREGSPKSLAYGERDRDRDRDREGASSPWGSPAFLSGVNGGGGGSGMFYQHGRKSSTASFSNMILGGSGRGSETGSDASSPTITNFTGIPIISPSPIPPPIFVPGSIASCPPVQEEDSDANGNNGNNAAPLPFSSSQTEPASLSGSVSWMHSGGDAIVDTTVQSPYEMQASPVQAAVSSLPPQSLPRRSGMGHRHKGSADSISYTMEEDSGETRWVMERRRLDETGEVEILEREVVEGGRI